MAAANIAHLIRWLRQKGNAHLTLLMKSTSHMIAAANKKQISYDSGGKKESKSHFVAAAKRKRHILFDGSGKKKAHPTVGAAKGKSSYEKAHLT